MRICNFRILSLQLNSSTSPMMDYERKETGNCGRVKIDDDEELFLSKTVVCHSLMQNKARNNFQVNIFEVLSNIFAFFCKEICKES